MPDFADDISKLMDDANLRGDVRKQPIEGIGYLLDAGSPSQ